MLFFCHNRILFQPVCISERYFELLVIVNDKCLSQYARKHVSAFQYLHVSEMPSQFVLVDVRSDLHPSSHHLWKSDNGVFGSFGSINSMSLHGSEHNSVSFFNCYCIWNHLWKIYELCTCQKDFIRTNLLQKLPRWWLTRKLKSNENHEWEKLKILSSCNYGFCENTWKL